MLRLLVDTSVWLDIAQRRDGQKWIVPMRYFMHEKYLQLLVPALVLEEFERNRPRAEDAVTTKVRERFRLLRNDLDVYADDERRRQWLQEMTHHIPLVSAMTVRNFSEISDLLRAGKRLDPTNRDRARVVQRGLDKQAPLHLNKNSVADALLIEMYASAVKRSRAKADEYWFVTSNYQDFSVHNGDRRQPHPDLADIFADDRTRYVYADEGLKSALEDYFENAYFDVASEVEFLQEEPRTFAEILETYNEFWNKVWYVRNFIRYPEGAELPDSLKAVETKYGRDELQKMIGPGHDEAWEYGCASGKLSALSWVLGSRWEESLDT
jgi:PIN domain